MKTFKAGDESFLAGLRAELGELLPEFFTAAGLRAGDLLVVGCSTSEVMGLSIGSESSLAVGRVIFSELNAACAARGVRLAAQCCEHLNRALVVEAEARGGAERVNAIPRPEAGGAFAAAAYEGFRSPVLVEALRADAGLDIGGTLIGMHLKAVAVPLRLSRARLGAALLLAARTRPRYIGGPRAVYDEALG